MLAELHLVYPVHTGSYKEHFTLPSHITTNNEAHSIYVHLCNAMRLAHMSRGGPVTESG